MSIHPTLAKINELQREMRDEGRGMFIASKFCPDTEIARVLSNIESCLAFFEVELGAIRSQVEALLDESGKDLLQDVESPDK